MIEQTRLVRIRIHSVITELPGPFEIGAEPDMSLLFPGSGKDDMPEREMISCTVEGRLHSDGEYLRLSYNEREDMGFSDNTSTIVYFKKAEPETVTMVRTGDVSTAIRFSAAEKRQVVSYHTGYFPIEFVMNTNRVVNTLTENGGELFLDYEIEIRGTRTQRTVLRLRVTREEKNA